MTRDFSARAERVTAVDCSTVALAHAKAHCSGCSNIDFASFDLLTDRLEGPFDFAVCAGVLNFFPRSSQAAICDKIVACLQPGGQLILEHLRVLMPGYEVTGEELHDLYAAHPDLDMLHKVREDSYEIVLLKRKS